ncbi:MAG: hypothetical protein M1828_001581 [Chrysothrix sp. TS-e1954]|nr:MAG: hypothetical protein M1828_001581 [Chrysothrix sp. TS-e1954]
MGDLQLFAALLSVPIFSSTASCYDLLGFDIDNSPAPPPSKGPPISAHANRNPADLKWEILGIVGAYVLSCLVIGTLLLTVGRRLRRAAQTSHGSLSMELVKPHSTKLLADKSPSVRAGRWGGFASKSSSTKASPEVKSHGHFDAQVLEAHKARQDQEMERLYAAVQAAENKQAYQPSSVDDKEMDARSSTLTANTGATQSHRHTRSLSSISTSRSFSQRRPPQSQRAPGGEPPTTPRSPPPGTIGALYPPHAPMPSDPGAATYSVHDTTQPYQLASSPPPPSGTSHSRQTSTTSTIQNRTSRPTQDNRPRHTRTLRNLTISAPLPKHHSLSPSEDEARTPLSPRYPTDYHQQYQHHTQPASSPPHSTRTSHTTQPTMPRPVTPILDDDDDDNNDADDLSSADGDSAYHASYHTHQTPGYAHDEPDTYGYSGLSSRGPLPLEAPQRLGQPPAPAIAPAASNYSLPRHFPQKTRTPPPPSGALAAERAESRRLHQQQQHQAQTQQAQDRRAQHQGMPQSNPLPLRSYSSNSTSTVPTLARTATRPAMPQAPPHANHPTGGTATYPSPTPTRTTFLSPRRDKFASARARALASAGMAPWEATTGNAQGQGGYLSPGAGPATATGPRTPYTPYTPFSPVTPVTPGLMSKKERKGRRREEGRRVKDREMDEVVEEGEMWGDAYR